MDNWNALSLGRKIVLGAGVLLLIDSFLDWQQVSFLGNSAGQSAWHGFWGVVFCLLTIVLIAWFVAKALGVEIPNVVPEGVTTLGVAAVILLFVVIKALSDSYVHWPAYLGIVLAAVMAYGAWLVFQDSGESLPRVPTSGTSTTTAAPSAAAPPATPPAATPEGTEPEA